MIMILLAIRVVTVLIVASGHDLVLEFTLISLQATISTVVKSAHWLRLPVSCAIIGGLHRIFFMIKSAVFPSAGLESALWHFFVNKGTCISMSTTPFTVVEAAYLT